MEWNLGSFRQPIQKVILGLVRYPRPESLRPKQLSRDTTLT